MAISMHIYEMESKKKRLIERSEMINNMKCE
jgi:hypothetical protein